jgi:hypothetical protein
VVTPIRRAQLATAIAFCLATFGSAAEPLRRGLLSHDPLRAPMAVTQQHSYIVNAKIRPLPLIWIGRDNIGGARITRRQDTSGRRAFEFLIGSDPALAPRHVNRWGFIAELLNGEDAEVLGVMKESNEETIDAAEAQTALESVGVNSFKAVRTTITGVRAAGGVMTVHAPARLTYRDLDALLALIPLAPTKMRVLELPPGTQKGFLVALDSLINASVDPCRNGDAGWPKNARSVPYVYNQSIYDLSLLSCDYEPELHTKTGAFVNVIDGRFQVKNRTTRYETKFRMFIGTSGHLRAIPVRALFRPRWWLDVEMVLDRSAGGTS